MTRVRKPFKPRPYVPGEPWPVDKRSPAQKAAHQRSFQIFQLRGLHALAHRLSKPRCQAVQAIIDEELAMLGAETEAKRAMMRWLEELGELLEQLSVLAEPDTEPNADADLEMIPF